MAKRLVVCCDGTWNTPEQMVSNIVRMARAIKPRSVRGVEQIVFYDWGVGTGNTLDRIKGGAFGKGLNKNIQDAYRFLVHNYSRGDHLLFFGFSRGAYTVRSLVGFIRNCGLLTKDHSDRIPEAFDLYRSDSHPDSRKSRNYRGQYSREVKVRFLGVWDTVGALGIPLRTTRKTRHSFHDTKVSSIIQHAYHALAVDEKRKPFRPTVWTTKPGRSNTEQVWFAGVHGDVGGGYPDWALADKTFLWMCEKAQSRGLDLKDAYVKSTLMKNSREKLHKSFRGIYRALGQHIRPIGKSNPPDESVHPSAIARFRDSKKKYRPENLSKFLDSQ